MCVINSTGKVLSNAFFIDPEGVPSAADSAFAGLRPGDWKILGYVRLAILNLTLSSSYMGVHMLVVAAEWPGSYAPPGGANYWWTLAPFIVCFYFGPLPWWMGVTGHFVLTSVATMLQLDGLREELEAVVADAEGTKTARSWRSKSTKFTPRSSTTAVSANTKSPRTSTTRPDSAADADTAVRAFGAYDGGGGGDSRVRWFRGVHSCMDDQLQRFSQAWQFYFLVAEFLIVVVLLLFYVPIANGTWRRADYAGDFPEDVGLAYLLFCTALLTSILPTLAGLAVGRVCSLHSAKSFVRLVSTLLEPVKRSSKLCFKYSTLPRCAATCRASSCSSPTGFRAPSRA
jgi:hypothetical protein